MKAWPLLKIEKAKSCDSLCLIHLPPVAPPVPGMKRATLSIQLICSKFVGRGKEWMQQWWQHVSLLDSQLSDLIKISSARDPKPVNDRQRVGAPRARTSSKATPLEVRRSTKSHDVEKRVVGVLGNIQLARKEWKVRTTATPWSRLSHREVPGAHTLVDHGKLLRRLIVWLPHTASTWGDRL